MKIVYTPGDWPQVTLTASSAEFTAMASRIAELVRMGSGEIAFPTTNSIPPNGADCGMSALVVRIGSGLALVAVRGDGVLAVSGGLESVGLFGQNMPVEAALPAGYHVHFESDGREWFVAPESLPLVMLVGPTVDAAQG
ncbi:MAG: hypothetical protein K8U57_34445 [Planctomycetes bacterium]|nr:hypothetical protein [Planctomycetota bacterium]